MGAARRGAALLLVVLATAPAAATASELPLGPRSLDERRSHAAVAPGVRWTRIVRAGGPWRVNVLALRPGTRMAVAPAEPVGRRTRPTVLARRLAGVAAVNGGYFAADGNPAGVLAEAAGLVSEPVDERSALLLGERPTVLALSFEGSASVGGRVRLLDGVNRPPGTVPACGGRGGDRPTERPDATLTCTDASELIAFTPAWGARTAAGAPRAEAVVRGDVVTAIRTRSGSVPRDGYVLAGTGGASRFLRRYAAPGAPAALDPALSGPNGPVDWPAPSGIVGGGPRLLARGRLRVRAAAEGFDPLSAPWFRASFVAARHPRTLAGVRADGTLLLVTVDGRRPGWSAGVTLPEAARVMRSLGARDALNLDGGGSTAMTVRGRVASRPSDASGERPVSDALVVLG